MDELALIFQTAQKCAEIATRMCKEFHPDDMGAVRKGDKTWVTEADKSIEKKLREVIQAAHPEHAILGEEQGGTLQKKGYTWILDPIDGTFSFVHGIPFYSSLIAVVKGNEPVIGIALLPGMGIEISSVRGRGVYINGQPYKRPSLVGRPHLELVATADPYRFRMEGEERVLQRLYETGFKSRTYPDALGYYLLLNGSVRAFVDPKVEIWDVAPFHVILPEAGFAIHPWNEKAGLRRGTSVAYPLGENAEPLNCSDVLAILTES